MPFLGSYMSGGTQKGKCGYVEIFKIQNTRAACGQHVTAPVQLENWNGRVIATQSCKIPPLGDVSSCWPQYSIKTLCWITGHHWSAGLVIVRWWLRSQSSQGSQERSNTTAFGWDDPDISGKMHPNPYTVNVHTFKIITMIKKRDVQPLPRTWLPLRRSVTVFCLCV